VGKHLLRQVLYRHVERSLIERPKMGFSPPIDLWLANEMAPLVESFLNEKRTQDAGIFKPEVVADIRRSFSKRSNDNTQKLWNLVVFEQWRQQWNFTL
jgi:asparagine synthase (glutamine-hydrolysing)